MMFWIVAVLLAASAALILALPLLRPVGTLPADRAHDAEVYRSQLKELARDQAEGQISSLDAEYARAEIGRRLISVSQTADAQTPSHPEPRNSRLFAAVIMLFVPLAALAFYAQTGSPDQPDRPLVDRLANPNDDLNILIARTEQHLAKNPDDGTGWELLAPIYLKNKRAVDSVNAWRNAIRVLGETPKRVGNFGEAMVVAAQGEVTADAKATFEEALKLDPMDARARFYLANRLEQLGKRDEALSAFESLAATAPKGAPWLKLVNDHITFIRQELASGKPDAKMPGNPTHADVEAASGMNANDRQQMIRTMVEGLDARLTAEPDNVEGWMRLMRSYTVLGEPDNAKAALSRALAAFPADSEQGRQLLGAATELGIPTSEAKP